MPLVTAWVSYFSCLIRYWSFGISPDFQDSYCFRDKTYFQTHLMCFGKSSGCFPSIYWLITNIKYLKVKSEVAQLCLILCDPMDCSLPGFSVYGIFQAKVVERVAISFSRGSSWTKDRTQVSHNASRCFTLWATREATNGIICPFFLVLSWWIPLTLA